MCFVSVSLRLDVRLSVCLFVRPFAELLNNCLFVKLVVRLFAGLCVNLWVSFLVRVSLLD